jgi:DNA-directed RNA polymerase subunit RPC12/RpoP
VPEELTSVVCPNCGEAIEFKKKFLDDEDAVAFCKNVDCFYVFYPARGEEISRKDYLVHQRPYTGDRTLGIRPERHGTFHHDNEPKNIKVPCPECGRVFHQTKRLNRTIKFRCPRCRHRFEMNPQHCVLAPKHVYPHHERTKGIRPDRSPQPRPKVTYVTTPCVDCGKDVRFAEDILKWENHAIICKDCGVCFDPVTKKVVLRRPPDPKPHMKQDEVKELLKDEK